MFSLRRVLGSALLRGSVSRRRVLSSFLCVVSSGVLCCVILSHDAEFRDVFFASCSGGLLEMGITDMVPGGVRILAKEMACFSARMGGLVRNCPYFPEIRHPRKRIGVFFCEDVDWVTLKHRHRGAMGCYFSFSKCSLPTPQAGHVQSGGRSSKAFRGLCLLPGLLLRGRRCIRRWCIHIYP